MMDMIAIVTVLALLQFVWFGIQVGSMRARHEVNAPAMSGTPEFERMFRVHYNTMEQLIVFLPALWLYAHMVNPMWGTGLGVVYLIGRFVYRAAYLKDPASRSTGFSLTFLPVAVMLVWVLVVAVMKLL
jgi:uncharacterized membrane protein YecN with MAPEG domain